MAAAASRSTCSQPGVVKSTTASRMQVAGGMLLVDADDDEVRRGGGEAGCQNVPRDEKRIVLAGFESANAIKGACALDVEQVLEKDKDDLPGAGEDVSGDAPAGGEVLEAKLERLSAAPEGKLEKERRGQDAKRANDHLVTFEAGNEENPLRSP